MLWCSQPLASCSSINTESQNKLGSRPLLSSCHSSQVMASFVLVGALWGCTNPWLKASSTPPPETSLGEEGSLFTTSLQSLNALTRAKSLLPFVLNQLGSVLFYYLLGTTGNIEWEGS